MLRYRLVALVYFLTLFPAALVAGNPDNSGHFYWNWFFMVEIGFATPIAAFIIVLAWVFNPKPNPLRRV